MAPQELSSEIASLAREQGKFVAIEHYRSATGRSLRKSRRDVEEILWRNGIPSETPPRFRWPHYVNWHRLALIGIPILLGLLLAWVLIAFFF